MNYAPSLDSAATHASLPEVVYRRLHSAILNGVYKPGQMLRQEELARSLGVSRAPLREALPRLEAEGIVVQLPRRGYAVVSLEADEIREIFDLRKLIEAQAASIATRRRTTDDVSRAKDILDRMEALDVTDADQRVQWFVWNSEFHETLLMPSGRRHFLRAIASLRTAVEPYIRVEISLTGNVDAANQEHREIVTAYEAQDVEKMMQLTCDHIEHTAQRLLTGLEHSRVSG